MNSKYIKEAMSQFPDEFGLKAFPGEKFCICESASYMVRRKVMLYVYTVDGESFCKGTVSELKKAIVDGPSS